MYSGRWTPGICESVKCGASLKLFFQPGVRHLLKKRIFVFSLAQGHPIVLLQFNIRSTDPIRLLVREKANSSYY